MTTVEELLEQARRRLSSAPGRIPLREAQLLLQHLLERSEAQLLARGEEPVPANLADHFRARLERRLAGEPAAYIVGEREFYGRPFLVDDRVLIPRPETEHLVEAAVAWISPPSPAAAAETAADLHHRSSLRILDIGTGSGCLAITLALELPTAAVTAVDLSLASLAVAAANSRRLGTKDRVTLVGADLAQGLRLESFDLVVSNPPYVDPDEAHDLAVEIRDHEPALALFSPGSGDSILTRLVAELSPLTPGTPVLFEIGYGQADRVRELAAKSAFRLREIVPDYAGIPRIAVLQRR